VASGGAPVTHGVASGDVTTDSAVIWSRSNQAAYMHVRIEGNGNDSAVHQVVLVNANDDFTGKIRVSGLRAGTDYRYSVWFTTDENGAPEGGVVEGRFRTPPANDQVRAVTFGFGGDLAGQNVCRDAAEGFPIFNGINATPMDFFVGLGDLIYADGICDAVGRYGNAQVPGPFVQSFDMANYWAHWKYNREDAGLRTLLSSMGYYPIWDDHEVVNDFGPLTDTRTAPPYTPGVHLMPLGLRAMLDYNPILPAANTPKRMYRSIRWGKNMDVYFLDNRQYRDSNFDTDDAVSPKTLLGREQLTWLKDSLKSSDATWKVIVSGVPMSIPTGPAGSHDGWANYQDSSGFEYELLDILRYMQQNGIYNVIWVTTDVHFSEVFRYTSFADDPTFKVHEFVTGPINAGFFVNDQYDTTLGTEVLFRYPTVNPTTYAEARALFNFGLIKVAEDGKLTGSVNDINGAPFYELTLDPH
jgi:alkaline phosphatase D